MIARRKSVYDIFVVKSREYDLTIEKMWDIIERKLIDQYSLQSFAELGARAGELFNTLNLLSTIETDGDPLPKPPHDFHHDMEISMAMR